MSTMPHSEAASACWVMTEGKAGMENPCLGLAEALGLRPMVKRISLRAPWRQLTPWLPTGIPWALAPSSARLEPPWPDLLISSGRQAVGLAQAIRRAGRGRTFCVHIHDPGISLSRFDAVVLSEHDGVEGPNVIAVPGVPHRVTPRRLAEEAAAFEGRFTGLPRPRAAVLIGGPSRRVRFGADVAARIAAQLRRMAQDGWGLMVTCSRRTGAENEAILREALRGLPVDFWDGSGPNPYFAYLGAADAVVVTSDSVAMMTEAASLRKPLYLIELEGVAPKFVRFRQSLYDRGSARPFTGHADDGWRQVPIDPTRSAAACLQDMLAQRGVAGMQG